MYAPSSNPGIGPITVELAQCKDFVIKTVHQYGVLVTGHALAGLAGGFHKAEQPLDVVFLCQQHLTLERTARDDHAPFRQPSGQPQTAAFTFPALAGIAPAGTPEHSLDMAFNVLRQPQPSCQRVHSPVSVRNSMKYAHCPIGVAALSVSQRTCSRPPAVCTALGITLSSALKRFNFAAPVG